MAARFKPKAVLHEVQVKRLVGQTRALGGDIMHVEHQMIFYIRNITIEKTGVVLD